MKRKRPSVGWPKRAPQRPVYAIELDQPTIEALEQGRCPETLSQIAHDLLRWRRESIRATAKPPVLKD